MNICGLRIHIAGSLALDTDFEIATIAHEFIGEIIDKLVARGAGSVLSCGAEPSCNNGLPATFDWTALSRISAAQDPGPNWSNDNRHRHCVVASQRSLAKIPEDRARIWADCRRRIDFDLQTIRPNWSFGGAIRTKQAAAGDILLILGGGTGVEHLASLYRDDGKPVIPIGGKVGGSTDQGHGGSAYLHRLAINHPSKFFDLLRGSASSAARLVDLRIDGSTNAGKLASEVISLIKQLTPRRAFLVRLLDDGHPQFGSVEKFFDEIVEPALVERGFSPHQVGRDRPLSAFMNVEIFEAIHRSSIVIADLTGLRPNCMIELGYALGRQRSTAISALRGTELPFDQDKLQTFFWNDGYAVDSAKSDYMKFLDRAASIPPLVDSSLGTSQFAC